MAWIGENQRRSTRPGRALPGPVWLRLRRSCRPTCSRSRDVEPKLIDRGRTGAVIRRRPRKLGTLADAARWPRGRALAARDAMHSGRRPGADRHGRSTDGDTPHLQLDLTSYPTLEQRPPPRPSGRWPRIRRCSATPTCPVGPPLCRLRRGWDDCSRIAGERLAFHDFVQRICSDDGNDGASDRLDGLKMLEGIWKEVGQADPRGCLPQPISLSPLAGGIMSRREMAEDHAATRVYDRVEAEFPPAAMEMARRRLRGRAASHVSQSARSIQDAPLLIVLRLHRALIAYAQAGSPKSAMRHLSLWPWCFTTAATKPGPRSSNNSSPISCRQFPLDRLTGEPLRLRTVDGRPLVCSVGDDRKAGGRAYEVAYWDGAMLCDSFLGLGGKPPTRSGGIAIDP